jgi:methionyl-tRNA formyltransferase
MKILFVGTVQFSYKALKTIIEAGGKIVGCITQTDIGENADYADLTPFCRDKDIPLIKINNINAPETLIWAHDLNPDIVFCFGWSRLLKKGFLNLAPMGVVGFHPAELPKNRGRHPLIWALVLGLRQTASTFFFMDEGADSGDILSQVRVEIFDEDEAGDLYDRIIKTATKQIRAFLPSLVSGNFHRIPQDHTKANYWRKRIKDDGRIDFRMTNRAVYNLVRALAYPYIGAHLDYLGTEVKIWRCRMVDSDFQNIEPGKVLAHEGKRLLVKCAEGAVWIEDSGFSICPHPGDYLR